MLGGGYGFRHQHRNQEDNQARLSLLGKKMLRKFQRKTKPESQFVEWCREDPSSVSGPVFDLNSFLHQPPPAPRSAEAFFDEINAALTRSMVKTVTIQTSTSGPRAISSTKPNYEYCIHNITISSLSQQLLLSNIAVRNLQIASHVRDVRVSGCKIANLNVQKDSKVNLVVEGTDIGRISFSENSVASLDVRGGSILEISCPPPGTANPFTGSVTFRDVYLPTNREKYLFSGPQPYRNMRHHLKSLENAQMANLFHSAELATERADDTTANRFLSQCYAGFSDYGASAFRPFLWLLGSYCVSATIIYLFAGAVVPVEVNLSGWKSSLAGVGYCSEVSRALVLALQPVVNPLQIFGVKALVEPRTGWIFSLMIVQSLFSLVWIALIVFAIRRRFKMQ